MNPQRRTRERRRIIQQVLGLHFPDDAITLRAMELLITVGYPTASVYLEVVDNIQQREIERGRLPSLRVKPHLSRVAL